MLQWIQTFAVCVSTDGVMAFNYVFGERQNYYYFCRLLKAAPLFPSVCPSSRALWLAAAAVCQFLGGAWARCRCSSPVEEGQLLSAAKQGREKNIQCVSSGHSFPKSRIYWPSVPETNMAWKDPWKISAKLSGVTRSGGLSCRCLEVFGCLPVVGPRRWRRRLSPRSGVPVCPAPCKT